MRLSTAIVISLALHAALALLPAAMSAPRPPETVEIAFRIETTPRLTPPPSPAEVAAPPLPVPPPPPAVTAKPPAPQPKPKPKPKPADLPPPPPAPPPPAELALETPAPEAAAAAPVPEAAPPAAALAALPAAENAPGPAVLGASGAPGFLKRVLPRYPRLAREMGREGTVVLALAIGEDGRLEEVEVLESAGPDFDEEAVRAVRASSFRPAVREGRAVASRAILPVKFVLKGATHD